MDFILVLAKIQPKDGCQDTIIELANELIYETLQEEGNIEYRLLKSSEDDNFGEESEEFVKNMDIQVIDAKEIKF